jgi:hypothetical protein
VDPDGVVRDLLERLHFLMCGDAADVDRKE